MKISDFLKQKLYNFKNFLIEQTEKVQIDETKKNKLLQEIAVYENDINLFIKSIVNMAKLNIDTAISIFLLNYDINIDEIRDKIDYNKLKRYIECFIDIVKN